MKAIRRCRGIKNCIEIISEGMWQRFKPCWESQWLVSEPLLKISTPIPGTGKLQQPQAGKQDGESWQSL